MFIRLTRLDNTPIWINACFVVTVEPRRAGGSIVVPIGDGLDYEVKETPETVLGMLGDAPAPAVVPVPPPPGLAPKTLGTTPAARPEPAEAPSAAPSAAPTKRTTRARSSRAKAADSGVEAEQPSDADAASDGKTSAKKPRTRRTKKSEEASSEGTSPEAAASEATEASLPAMPLSDDELVRLRKLAPGTVRKLQNTLKAQFRTTEPEAAVAALEAHGVLSLDRDHVIWR